jgi:hypothetical protein
VGSVDDRATDGEWNLVRSGDPARNMGFHVNGGCACMIMQSPLVRGTRNWGIRPGNFR